MEKIKKKVVKKDNQKVDFNHTKIIDAILNASTNTKTPLPFKKVQIIVNDIVNDIKKIKDNDIESKKIYELILENLRKNEHHSIAKKIEDFSANREKNRFRKTKLMGSIRKIAIETDRENANVGNNFSAKLLKIASEANKWHILNDVLPSDMAKAHENGDYYIHDLDSYNLTVNCLHVPTYKMLSEGFNTGYGMTKPAKRIETAAALSCILVQSSQNDMFGGQSHPNFDNDLAPFVKMTRKEIEKQCVEMKVPKNEMSKIVERILIKRIKQSAQAVIYNLNTMHSRAGAQVPFSSINIGIPDTKEAAMLCQAILEEYLKGMGNGEQAIFPNIVFRVKSGINRNPGDPYYYLFQLACHVSSQRMNPTFMNMDADFNKQWFDKKIYPATMGCRTYVMSNINGKPGVEGRGNIAPVTINLVRLGYYANKDVKKFFKLFEEKIEQCKNQLLHRYDVVKKLKVKDLPFVAGQHLMKGSEKLKDNDSIEPILKQGTYGIGFIGLAETLKLLTGKHHGESKEAQELGVKIISFLRQKTDELKEKYKLNFSCYATPAEGLSGKFTQLDKKNLGIIKWINSKDFYTNGFHVPVDFPISFSKKLEIEAPYHKLCNAGHISYIEFDDYPDAKIIEKITQQAFEKTNIGYIGFNFHIRYCKDCVGKE